MPATPRHPDLSRADRKSSGAAPPSRGPLRRRVPVRTASSGAADAYALQAPAGGIHSLLALVGLFVVSAGLKTLIFPPIGVWPLAGVCCVPWILGVGLAVHSWRVYVFTLLTTGAFYLFNMRWLYQSAEGWYAALAVYMALFDVMASCPLRHSLRRRSLPAAVAFPVIWTGAEFLRGTLFSGFPWFMLAHSQYQVRPLIQIADLAGAYGVTFVIAAINGAVADWLLWRLRRTIAFPAYTVQTGPSVPARAGGQTGDAGRPAGQRSVRFSLGFAAVLLALTLIYGFVQLSRNTMSPGPKIAVIQGDYLNTVTGDEVSPVTKFMRYRELVEEAATLSPDLVLLPESAWGMWLNPDLVEAYLSSHADPRNFNAEGFRFVYDFCRQRRTHMVVGASTVEFTPLDLMATERMYNSAYVFFPDGRPPERYDKRHLVYFGELVPFRFGRLRPLYFWINARIPFSGPNNDEFSAFPGESFRTFELLPTESDPSVPADRRVFRFGIPICYEDVMPYISRQFAVDELGAKRTDFLLNISNDGWFGHGGQQKQHLSTCVFRAVENRLGIARAVNTGISGFIDPDGRMHDLVNPDGPIPGGDRSGFAVAHVMIDSRVTWYSLLGDWFGWMCLILGGALYLDYTVVRIRTRHHAPVGN